jgi:hypothetical protein
MKGKGRIPTWLDSLKEAGLPKHGVAHAPAIVALLRAATSLQHGRWLPWRAIATAHGCVWNHLMRGQHGCVHWEKLPVVVIITCPTSEFTPAALVPTRWRDGGEQVEWHRWQQLGVPTSAQSGLHARRTVLIVSRRPRRWSPYGGAISRRCHPRPSRQLRKVLCCDQVASCRPHGSWSATRRSRWPRRTRPGSLEALCITIRC